MDGTWDPGTKRGGGGGGGGWTPQNLQSQKYGVLNIAGLKGNQRVFGG